MKTLMNTMLVLALSSSTLLANGDMGGGGRTDCNGAPCPPPPCTIGCGFAADEPATLEETSTDGSIETDMVLVLVQNYLSRIF